MGITMLTQTHLYTHTQNKRHHDIHESSPSLTDYIQKTEKRQCSIIYSSNVSGKATTTTTVTTTVTIMINNISSWKLLSDYYYHNTKVNQSINVLGHI